MDAELGWEELEERLLHRCRVFDLVASRRRAKDGREGEFYLLQAPDWVTAVPLIRGPQGEDRFLMVRQFRHGLNRVTVEFPSGLAAPGEPPEQAAARELAEETGRTAGSWHPLGAISPNPAFMNNRSYTYLAEDLSLASGPKLDPLELLEVVEVPVERVLASIGSDPFQNAMTLVALYWFLRHRQKL